MVIRERLYTVDEFWEFLDRSENADRKFELVNGVIVEDMSPGLEHGVIIFRLGGRLQYIVEANDLGVIAGEVDHYTRNDRYNTRRPDIEFISKERLQQVKDQTCPVSIMPDLATEVKSPGNTHEELLQKAAYYLQNGSLMVCLVYPETRTMSVFTPDNPEPLVLGIDDTFSGGDVLPGFTMPLKDLFGK